MFVVSIDSPGSLELSQFAFSQTLGSLHFLITLSTFHIPKQVPSLELPAKMSLILLSLNTFLLRQPSESFPHHLRDNCSQPSIFISKAVFQTVHSISPSHCVLIN